MVFNVIICGLKIPYFKFGANVHTFNELSNNNFSIIFNSYLSIKTIGIGALKTIFMPFEEIWLKQKLRKINT
jgi:hypothetical protein